MVMKRRTFEKHKPNESKIVGEVAALRVAGYIRIDCEKIIGDWPLAEQMASIKQCCEANGWELVKLYVEDGLPAWAEGGSSRPAHLRMLSDIEDGEFDLVITNSMGTLPRDMPKTVVPFFSIQDGLKISGSFGEIFRAISSLFEQYQSSVISSETKKGMHHRKRRGFPHGRAPFGYARCDEDCRGQDEGHPYWHIEEEDAALVRKAYELYATECVSMSKIAEILNQSSLLGTRLFTPGSISYMLHNPHYAGLLRLKTEYGEELIPGVQNPIVSEVLYARVGAILESNGRGLAKVLEGDPSYLRMRANQLPQDFTKLRNRVKIRPP